MFLGDKEVDHARTGVAMEAEAEAFEICIYQWIAGVKTPCRRIVLRVNRIHAVGIAEELAELYDGCVIEISEVALRGE